MGTLFGTEQLCVYYAVRVPEDLGHFCSGYSPRSAYNVKTFGEHLCQKDNISSFDSGHKLYFILFLEKWQSILKEEKG